jgi:predicted DNA-binding transcriptional regulator YafY
MMTDNDTSRLSRLTAILTQLQSKRLLTSTELSKKFEVSVRTIYRDVKALQASGVPIYAEEGKGYSLMEGYRLPPVMFTESEANALITAEQLVLKNNDVSLIENYQNAITKIKSVLKYETKDKVELLSNRIYSWQSEEKSTAKSPLTTLQLAITHFNLSLIEYQSVQNEAITTRTIEPFALYNTAGETWLLVAWCRLRKDFRTFRVDKIVKIEVLKDQFLPHKMTIGEYYEKYVKNAEYP